MLAGEMKRLPLLHYTESSARAAAPPAHSSPLSFFGLYRPFCLSSFCLNMMGQAAARVSSS